MTKHSPISDKKTDFREAVSKILVKWGMGTRQVAILEIVREHERLLAVVGEEIRKDIAKKIHALRGYDPQEFTYHQIDEILKEGVPKK